MTQWPQGRLCVDKFITAARAGPGSDAMAAGAPLGGQVYGQGMGSRVTQWPEGRLSVQTTLMEPDDARMELAIRAELEAFFDVHMECGSHPGGVHLEMTGKDVTECIGGDTNSVELEGARGALSRCGAVFDETGHSLA